MLGTETASVTGTELSEEERPTRQGSGPLQAGSGGLGFVGVWGFQSLEQPDSVARGLISRIQKHMAQIFPFNLGERENVDKIAEIDLKWEGGSLFNTGWHFQGREEVQATVSS